MALYLLDANVLIDANMYYYPIERIPEFWNWLEAMGQQGLIKIPSEIFDEVVKPRPDDPDQGIGWLLERENSLVFEDATPADLVARVTEEGYGDNLSDVDIAKIGRDPFLIAYAVQDTTYRTVVSNEVSRPSTQGANRRVPDVCTQFNVRCINVFQLIRELDFRTDWGENT